MAKSKAWRRTAYLGAAQSPDWCIDESLVLALSLLVTKQASIGIALRSMSLFWLFCVAVLAVVTTYHTCRVTSVQGFQPLAISAPHPDAPDHASFSGEKCHTCTMVSLPAFSILLAVPDQGIVCDGPAVDCLTSFHSRLTSPPPKA